MSAVDPLELEIELPEGVRFHRVFYLNGPIPKNKRGEWPLFEVNTPPLSGYTYAFVVGKPDARRLTMVHPWTLEAHDVSPHAGELEVRDQRHTEMTQERLDRLVATMREKWRFFQSHGKEKPYDATALLFRRLGLEPPEQLMKGGDKDERVKGGKQVFTQLLKPVKRNGKRGRFLEWFLADGGGPKSLREAMDELDMKRSNLLSYLFMLNKDHGLGYSLVGETAEVHLPEGCSCPFDVPKEDEDDDDSWLD